MIVKINIYVVCVRVPVEKKRLNNLQKSMF